jgi:hypothetical protein
LQKNTSLRFIEPPSHLGASSNCPLNVEIPDRAGPRHNTVKATMNPLPQFGLLDFRLLNHFDRVQVNEATPLRRRMPAKTGIANTKLLEPTSKTLKHKQSMTNEQSGMSRKTVALFAGHAATSFLATGISKFEHIRASDSSRLDSLEALDTAAYSLRDWL